MDTICIMRQLTQCTYYGQPLAQELFKPNFSEEKIREAELDHLIGQVRLIAEKLREVHISDPTKTDHSDVSNFIIIDLQF